MSQVQTPQVRTLQVQAPPGPNRFPTTPPPALIPRRRRVAVSLGVDASTRLLLIVAFAWILGGGIVAYWCAVAGSAILLKGRRGHGQSEAGRAWSALGRISAECSGWLVFAALGGPGAGTVVAGELTTRALLAGVVSTVLVASADQVIRDWLLGGQRLAGQRARDDRQIARPQAQVCGTLVVPEIGSIRFLRGCLILPVLPLLVEALGVLSRNGATVALGAWTIVSLVMLVVAGLTLFRAQYTWQVPERVDHVDLSDQEPPRHSFSLIIPARQEPVLERTLTQTLSGDYPHELFELIVVVSDDEVDRETRAVARSFADRYPNVRVITPSGAMRSKPLSLEDARKYCQGDLIGIIDAESLIARGLLSYVNTLAVRQPATGIFQGGVQLMNVRAGRWRWPQGAGPLRALVDWLDSGTSWWRARNCLEYYIWFMSRLRYQATARFIPLGGNTVFVRRGVLKRLGGWDPTCLTEDCDLGVRASVAGIRTAVFYHPELTTQEETPESLGKLVIQRTRWMMGFIQVLRKGDWRKLPGWRRRLLAVEMLFMPFFQAAAGLVLPVSILMTFVLRGPAALVIVFWLPLMVMAMMVATEQAAFREFARAYQLGTGPLDSIRLIVSAPIYQLVLSVAAIRAMLRMLQGKFQWEKTAHVGAHHLALLGPSKLEGAS